MASHLPQGLDQRYYDPNNAGIPIYDTRNAKGMHLTRHFTVRELSSTGDVSFRYSRIDPQLVNCLEGLRLKVNRPLYVKSSYRSWHYNKQLLKEGKDASKTSFHLSGKAADICVPGVSLVTLIKSAYEACGCRIGIGVNSSCMHIDTRGYPALWSYSNVDKKAFSAAKGIRGRQDCGRSRVAVKKKIYSNKATLEFDEFVGTLKQSFMSIFD